MATILFSGSRATGPSKASSMELEFVFVPADADALDGGPGPRHRPKPWRNPNRPGTPLAFWREVKDVLRLLTLHRRRGSYIAPGPHGRRNNIVRDPVPRGSGSPPGHHQQDSAQPRAGEEIAQLPSHTPHLEMPALPPFERPKLEAPFLVATRPPHKPAFFKGRELAPDKPISYSQEVLFIGGTADFFNRAEASRVMSGLLDLLREHPEVEVYIIGNAADDFKTTGFRMPYGHDKALLRKAPLYGTFGGRAYYGDRYRTIGDLMLGRARAIGNLLISRGIANSRVHCAIGALGYGKKGVPGSGARKRRATIIVKEKRR